MRWTALLNALGQEADPPAVVMCRYCGRLRRSGSDDAEGWVTAETYYQRGGSRRVRIRYGICPDCDAARFPDP